MSAGINAAERINNCGNHMQDVANAVKELIEAARDLDSTYGWHWDRIDGAAVIMPEMVGEFEARAHRLNVALSAFGGGA